MLRYALQTRHMLCCAKFGACGGQVPRRNASVHTCYHREQNPIYTHLLTIFNFLPTPPRMVSRVQHVWRSLDQRARLKIDSSRYPYMLVYSQVRVLALSVQKGCQNSFQRGEEVSCQYVRKSVARIGCFARADAGRKGRASSQSCAGALGAFAKANAVH